MTRIPPAPLLAALLLASPPARATVPPVVVPPHHDSVSVASPEAPLLVPGRTTLADTTPPKSRAQLAIEQYALGREFEREGNPVAAITAYRNAVKLDPTIPQAHFRMGRLYTTVGQHAYARDEYAAEAAHHPTNIDARRWLGLEMAQLGDTARAIAQLEGLVRRDPKDQPSWQALGFAYSTAGRKEQGEAALRRALALDERDADAWRDLGVVLAAERRDDEARRAYRRSIELDPRDAGTFVDLGNLERRNQRFDAALEQYRHATDVDSSQALAWRGQIEVLRQTDHAVEAGQVYRRWVETEPHNTTLRVEAMEYFDGLGRPDVSLELGREGVRLSPRIGETHLALGMAYHGVHDYRAALGELRRAEALFANPDERGRVGALIRAMRAAAPDSLRAFFAADSAAHERPAPADTASPPQPGH